MADFADLLDLLLHACRIFFNIFFLSERVL